MNDDQREQARANAKYLRAVRPVDPEEIHAYIEGEPHPAVVREELRQSAPELGFIECADGTFVPVSADPIEIEFDGVGQFPESHSRTLEDLLVSQFGAGWPDGESGTRLRERIRQLKKSYFAGEHVEYDTETALAYAIYHLPDYYAAVQYVLAGLARDDLLSHHLRILDVGAGVGGPALGLADFLPEDALCEYHAIEPSAAADVLTPLLDSTGRNFHSTVHRTTAEAFDIDGEYDLVLFANVLSELDRPVEITERYLDALAEDGSLVAIAPADRETSIGLREVERELTDNGPATLYAPTVRLWPGHAPTDRGWSFDVRPDLDVPPFQRRLAAQADDGDEFVNVDVQFSYSILRPNERRRIEFTPNSDDVAKMADMERHVSNRVDLVAAKLSHSLASGNPLFKISDGSESMDQYAVVTHETALNRDLLDAEYGTLLAFENVLVLWNADEEAYNLIVDGETIVDRIPSRVT